MNESINKPETKVPADLPVTDGIPVLQKPWWIMRWEKIQ
jgi:hypothetical protein